MKKTLLLALLPMTALFGVAGCDDGYSAAVVYPLRTDPIKMKDTGFDSNVPDRPGQLPLASIAEIDNVHNPFYKINLEKNLVKLENFRDPMMASASDRAEIKKNLDELFGTPGNPKVGPMSDEDRKTLQLVEGADGNLVKGGKLYRVHCLHCHGVSGDGRGPTGRWVNPHPRDYRQGQFKFTSTTKTKPSRHDLLRTLEVGIDGTAMPSFTLLTPEQRNDLVSYIIHLSIRGEVEYRLFTKSYVFKENNTLQFSDEGKTIKESIMSWYPVVVGDWITAQSPDSAIKVGDYPYDDPNEKARFAKFKESVLEGKKIFENPPQKIKEKVGEKGCTTCHIDYGRRSTFREDIWGTYSKPLNFTQGVFHGGRRPVDIYYRIHSGIVPSGMIAFGEILEPKEIWDLVNFVQVLGNPTMRRQLGIFVD